MYFTTDYTDYTDDTTDVYEDKVDTTVGKAITTSNTSFKTSNTMFTVDGDFDNKKVEFYPIENVATFGKNEWGKFYVKAEHAGNCTFKMVSENEDSISTNNVSVDILGDTDSF